MSFSMPRKIEFTEKSSDLLENSSIKTESDMLVPVYDYSIPAWGYVPDIKLSIEIIKSGVTIGNIIWPKNKSFMIFGRMESCDLILDHSSVSRFHAILQYSTGKFPSILC